MSVQVVSVTGHEQRLVDSGARSGGGSGDAGPPQFLSTTEKTVYLHPLQAFSGLYTNPKCIFVRGYAPTQPGSSYYYLLTRPGPGAPHWLLTSVSSILTQNFGRMSFGGLFPAGGPTHVRTMLKG